MNKISEKINLSSAKTKNLGITRLVKLELRTTGHWTCTNKAY